MCDSCLNATPMIDISKQSILTGGMGIVSDIFILTFIPSCCPRPARLRAQADGSVQETIRFPLQRDIQGGSAWRLKRPASHTVPASRNRQQITQTIGNRRIHNSIQSHKGVEISPDSGKYLLKTPYKRITTTARKCLQP